MSGPGEICTWVPSTERKKNAAGVRSELPPRRIRHPKSPRPLPRARDRFAKRVEVGSVRRRAEAGHGILAEGIFDVRIRTGLQQILQDLQRARLTVGERALARDMESGPAVRARLGIDVGLLPKKKTDSLGVLTVGRDHEGRHAFRVTLIGIRAGS